MVKSNKVLLLAILPAILVFPAFYKFTRFQESNAHDNWTKTFGTPIEDLTRHFPSRSDNEPAVRLKQLAIKLGIEFTTPGDTDLFLPIYKDAKREKLLAGFNGLLASYVRRQIEKPNASIDPPSEIVSSYLTDYKTELEAVRDHILSSPPILWRQNLNHWDMDKQPDNVLPWLKAILELQRTMIACAVDLGSRNKFNEAGKYLEAGWNLNQALREHPAILSQLIGLSIDRQWLGVIRKLPVDLDWTHKIAEHNYRKWFVKGFQVEAWQLWRWRDAPLFEIPMLNAVLEPYTRLCVASGLEKERKEIESLRSLNPCSLHIEDFDEITESSKWNLIQPERWPNQKKDMYGRVTVLEIDRELTAIIIRANHGLLSGENSEWSQACPDGIWAFHKQPDGAITIDYASPLEIPDIRGPLLPTSFTLNNNAL